MKKFYLILMVLLVVSCGQEKKEDSSSSSSDSNVTTVIGALSTVTDGVQSAGESMGSGGLIGLRANKNINSFTESESTALSYCSQYGRAWDSTNAEAAEADDPNYAIHMLECTARIEESTETPLGFLTSAEFIVCILEDAGVDFATAGTYSDITVNPINASASCKARTESNIKEEDQDLSLIVTVEDNPTGWDKAVTISAEIAPGVTAPFYKLFASFGDSAIALKAIEFYSGVASNSVDVHINRGQGALLFEMTTDKEGSEGHVRLLVEGSIDSSYQFSNVSNVEGIKTIGTDETNSNSWSGATLKGNPSETLFYEALEVSNGVDAKCASGCTADTGSSCGSSQCVSFGAPSASPFVDESAFNSDITDETSGPICFASVTNSTAPTRSVLSSCTIN